MAARNIASRAGICDSIAAASHHPTPRRGYPPDRTQEELLQETLMSKGFGGKAPRLAKVSKPAFILYSNEVLPVGPDMIALPGKLDTLGNAIKRPTYSTRIGCRPHADTKLVKHDDIVLETRKMERYRGAYDTRADDDGVCRRALHVDFVRTLILIFLHLN